MKKVKKVSKKENEKTFIAGRLLSLLGILSLVLFIALVFVVNEASIAY